MKKIENYTSFNIPGRGTLFVLEDDDFSVGEEVLLKGKVTTISRIEYSVGSWNTQVALSLKEIVMSWQEIQEELLSLCIIDEFSSDYMGYYGKFYPDTDTHLWGHLGAALIMAYTKKTV